MTFSVERAHTDAPLYSARSRFGALRAALASLALVAATAPQLSAAIDPAQPASELLEADQTHALHNRLNDLHSPQSFGVEAALVGTACRANCGAITGLSQSCINAGSVQSVRGPLFGGKTSADPKVGDFAPMPASDNSVAEQKELTRKPPRTAQTTDIDMVMAALREMPKC